MQGSQTVDKKTIDFTVTDRGPSLLYKLTERGVMVGFLELFKSTDPTETHPFKAFRAIVGQGPVRCGDMVGAFYGATGFRDAVRALKAAESR